MAVDLSKAIRTWALSSLPYDTTDSALVAEMQAKDARELLIVYHNWIARHIPAKPRRVHLSAAYMTNPIAAARQADLDALVTKIESGIDLTPHLSKRIKQVVESSTKKIARRQDLDLMLLEWEVHHLHISQAIEADGFVTRDDPLLFVVFHEQDAYVLDLMTHHDFNRDHILEILADEWPDANLIHLIKGAIGLSVHYTEEERNQLRKVGVNCLVEVNGRVFKPAGGVTTAGTAVKASLAADHVLQNVRKFEYALNNTPEKIAAMAQAKGYIWPTDPKFEFFALEPHGLGFVETTTQSLFPVA
ncbi:MULTISPECIES: hypothetical protein [unclassified Rhizobium]|uniref:hypothetical protein n=1 Tax=unclassified Rhizobium TaxID=2613769 RepID=UPI000BD6FA9F|nr:MULTISPECIES: hypothetical protein [unclassified Rhizobium]MDH7806859.1 hypothetical protein [Rhizobium sp. AN67]MDQ4408141.1 hypothetical protein [Rhizobium sp. AN63]SOD57675.1 hypothetical protein SAMN05216595_3808 [Rhizobium sp. AN6A]